MDNWPILERFVLCSEVIFDPVFGLWMKAPPTGSLSCSSGRLEALSRPCRGLVVGCPFDVALEYIPGFISKRDRD